MPSLDKRLTKVEDALVTHLTESGEIRGAIKTLTEQIDKISDRMWYALWMLTISALGIVGFLLKVTLWK